MENKRTASAHTPGPWTYSALDPKHQEPDSVSAYRIDGNHMYESVADVFYREDEGEAEANARLIAAAPELLASCIAAVDALNQMPNRKINSGVHKNTYSVCSMLDAAIAKAKAKTTPTRA